MNQHIADYNFLFTILPEMGIWNKIVLLLDHKTIDNLFLTFPVLRLFCDYTCSPEFIGTFIITEELTLVYWGGKEKKFSQEKIPVYKVSNSDRPIRYTTTEQYLLICDTHLFMVDRDGTPRDIDLVYQNQDETFLLVYFIPLIEKYGNISEGFFIMISQLIDAIISKSPYDIKNLLDTIEFLIPRESPMIELPRSEVRLQMMEIGDRHLKLKEEIFVQ